MRLNGWHRLWIVVSILYFVPVAAFVALTWPTAATTWHRDAFIARLPDELRAHVEAAYDSEYSWKDSLKSEIPPPPDYRPPVFTPGTKTAKATPLPSRFTLVSAPVRFPNGAVLQVRVAKEGDTEPDARVAPAYWAVVEGAARAARWTTAWQAFGAWFVPCLSLYALGWAVAWVRRGFRTAT